MKDHTYFIQENKAMPVITGIMESPEKDTNALLFIAARLIEKATEFGGISIQKLPPKICTKRFIHFTLMFPNNHNLNVFLAEISRRK